MKSEGPDSGLLSGPGWPPNGDWPSPGVHFSVKSYLPFRPVWLITMRPISGCVESTSAKKFVSLMLVRQQFFRALAAQKHQTSNIKRWVRFLSPGLRPPLLATHEFSNPRDKLFLFTTVDPLRSSHLCRTQNLEVFEWHGFSVPAPAAAKKRSCAGYFRPLIGYFCRRRLWRMSGQNSLMMLLRAADSSPVAQFSPVLRKPRSCGG